MNKACLLLLLLGTSAMAQEVPDEAKKAALIKAYRINGDSMKGWGSVDLSDDPEIKCYLHKGQATGQAFFECPQPEKVVKTEKIKPEANFENRVLTPPPPQKRTR